MKRKFNFKKVACTFAIGFGFVTSFFAGKYIKTEYDVYNANLETVKKITDWNTNGDELVLNIGDYEFYAYKSENIYANNKGFLPFDQIVAWSEENNTLYITLSDGNVYMINK
jgi:hypothetical protein